MSNEKTGGLFPLPKSKSCRHTQHDPPMHLHIPPGNGYNHVCPGCGEAKTIIPLQITLRA